VQRLMRRKAIHTLPEAMKIAVQEHLHQCSHQCHPFYPEMSAWNKNHKTHMRLGTFRTGLTRYGSASLTPMLLYIIYTIPHSHQHSHTVHIIQRNPSLFHTTRKIRSAWDIILIIVERRNLGRAKSGELFKGDMIHQSAIQLLK
jgi:hypothetical protein